jgi:uncharacterized protein
MTVEVTLMDIDCNMRCPYCYQNPMRDAGVTSGGNYNIDAVKKSILATGQPFALFGGEALMVPKKDLREMFRFGLEHYRNLCKKHKQTSSPNGIQTNGTLIDEDHLQMFKEFHVHVGFSLDGPEELNRGRWMGTEEKTDAGTKHSLWAIKECLKRGIPCSLILTLHRGNVGTPDRQARVKTWLRDLAKAGLRSARLHNLEVEFPQVKDALELTDKENMEIFLDFAKFDDELKKEGTPISFDIFRDLEKGLMGDQNVTCTFGPCDPYTTPAVHGIDGQGNLSNCGRVQKDGVNYLKAKTNSKERQLALYHTPQEEGGCQGCRFFMMCKGQCPGTAIDGDWRNRSKDCGLWMALFRYTEEKLIDQGKIPKSIGPDRVQREKAFLKQLWSGSGQEQRPHGDHTDHGDSQGEQHGDEHGDHTDHQMSHVIVEEVEHGDEHGDHTDMTLVEEDHGDAPHGDSPHGDHTDMDLIVEEVR